MNPTEPCENCVTRYYPPPSRLLKIQGEKQKLKPKSVTNPPEKSFFPGLLRRFLNKLRLPLARSLGNQSVPLNDAFKAGTESFQEHGNVRSENSGGNETFDNLVLKNVVKLAKLYEIERQTAKGTYQYLNPLRGGNRINVGIGRRSLRPGNRSRVDIASGTA